MNLKPEKIYMLSWIIIPLFGIWIAINYIIGVSHHPIWNQTESNTEPRVISAATQSDPTQKFEKIQWQNTGLITLWFDDAWLSQYLVGLPILEKNGMKGALAVPTRLVGYDAYMSWAQIHKTKDKGWEITAHTRTHNCEPQHLTPEQVESELAGSKQDLLDQGIKTDHFVTPCGYGNQIIIETAKKHFISLRSSGSGINTIPISNPYDIQAQAIHNFTTREDVERWINEAKLNSSWLILMFHQIDHGTEEYATTPTKFNQIIEAVKQSGLPVVLPSQVFEVALNQN